MKIRAFYKPNNGITLMYLVRKLREGETEEQALNAEALRAGITLPYDDFEPTEFPDKTKKAKWRGEKGKGIWVDESIITPSETRKAKEDELDAELAKETPDPVMVIRLNRDLDKMK
jgi:hypothetical protein